MSLVRSTHALALVLTVGGAATAYAQDCPGLPPVEPPKLEDCGKSRWGSVAGAFGLGCKGRNQHLQASYERKTRGFATGLEYNSQKFFATSLDDASRVETVDELRGCRGETVNIEITPGNVQYFEYQLVSPTDVVVSQQKFPTWTGDRILGPSLTLPESGTYKLITRTTAASVTKGLKNKDGSVRYVTSYPRAFRVGFRSDANVSAIGLGEKVDATATNTQPFIRRVRVPGGSKARLRLASQGTGEFSYVVLRETGEELKRGERTTYVDVPAVTPTADETFRVEARPFFANTSVGIQLTVLDDKATGTTLTSTSRIQSAFKLPAQFDSDNNAAHKNVYATETSRLVYAATGAERLTMTVRPSGATGLVMRVRVFDESTEDVILDRRVAQPTPIALDLPHAGSWVITLAPLSATEMPQAGEAKYTVDFAPRAAAPVRRAGQR
jgi:hypothetical protein